MTQSREEKNRKDAIRKRERWANDPEYRAARAAQTSHWLKEKRRTDPEWAARKNDAAKEWQAAHPKPPKPPMLGPSKPPMTRKERNAYQRAYYHANAEKWREYQRPRAKAYYHANPTVTIQGDVYRISKLPSELRPVAELIRETRLELRKRNG